MSAEFRPLTIADYDRVLALWQACEGAGVRSLTVMVRIAGIRYYHT